MALDMKGLFVNPATLRQDRLDQLSARRAQLGTMGGSMAGLLGQVAGGGSILGEQLAEGIAGGLGLKTKQEKQAEAVQSAMKGIKYDDPESMLMVADKLDSAGNAQAANALRQNAAKVQAQQSSAAAASLQQQKENAFRERELLLQAREVGLKALKEAREGEKSAAELKRLEAEVNNINSQIAERDELLGIKIRKGTAEAESIETQNTLDQALIGTRIAQAGADLGLTIQQQNQIKQSIDQAAAKFPEELKGLTLDNISTEASTALTRAQANRTTALTGLEVKKIIKETELLGYQQEATQALTEERKARLDTMNSTDFLKELTAANLSKEEEQQLIRQRLEAQAASGGVEGFGTAVLETRLEQLTRFIDTGKDASKSLSRAETMLDAMNEANIGKGSTVLTFANSWLAALPGMDEAKATTAANDLVRVLTGEITLDAASNLKGALSDKDLEFLKTITPDKSMSPQGMRNVFTRMAASHYADVEVARQMDEYLAGASAGELQSTPLNNKANEVRQQAERAYLLMAKRDGLYTGPMGRPVNTGEK